MERKYDFKGNTENSIAFFKALISDNDNAYEKVRRAAIDSTVVIELDPFDDEKDKTISGFDALAKILGGSPCL